MPSQEEQQPIKQDWETRQLVQTLTNALHAMQTTVNQFGERGAPLGPASLATCASIAV
jgi:hypothetical protein